MAASPSSKEQLGKKDKKSSSKPTPQREGYKADEAWSKKLAQLEENQAKRDREMNLGFQNVSKSLEKISQDLINSRKASLAQDQGRKRKDRGNSSLGLGIAPKAAKKNVLDLMELADDSEGNSSENEHL